MEEIANAKITDFKIIQGVWGNGEYKYNVQVLYDDQYCGFGKFVRTYDDALDYIAKVIEQQRGE